MRAHDLPRMTDRGEEMSADTGEHVCLEPCDILHGFCGGIYAWKWGSFSDHARADTIPTHVPFGTRAGVGACSLNKPPPSFQDCKRPFTGAGRSCRAKSCSLVARTSEGQGRSAIANGSHAIGAWGQSRVQNSGTLSQPYFRKPACRRVDELDRAQEGRQGRG